MTESPYASPESVTSGRASSGLPIHWFRSIAAPLLLWFGVVLVILGSMISFVPGRETYWFSCTSLLIAGGLFASGYKYKIASIILLVLCLIATYNGYIRGIEYVEFLKTRRH